MWMFEGGIAASSQRPRSARFEVVFCNNLLMPESLHVGIGNQPGAGEVISRRALEEVVTSCPRHVND